MSTLHHDGRKLPPGWVKCESAKYGTPYFFNTQTGKSVWFPPESPSQHPRRPAPAAAAAADDGLSSPPAKRSRQLSPPPLPPPSPSPPRQRETGADAEGSRVGAGAAAAAAAAAPGAAQGLGVKVAIIVPYRDLDPAQKRSAHLSRFVPYMEDFLARQQLQHHQQQQQLGSASAAAEFHVYVVEQSSDDGRKFNRGKLLNIGFDLARGEGCGAFLFHDVDLLPSDELGRWYSTRPDRPVHVARVWKQYSSNPKYFGGVVAFNQEDFEKINGFPNTFWGWGGEDDEMYSRIVEAKLQPQKAEEGDFTDLEGLDLKTKLGLLRKNEQWKCQVKKEALEEHVETWRRNGLADLKYKVLGRTSLAERSEKVTVDVEFNDHWTDTITHWKDLDKRHKKP